MGKLKLIIVGVVVAAVVITLFLSLSFFREQPLEGEGPGILAVSKKAVEDIESLEASAYFFQSLETPKGKDSSEYAMRILMLRGEGKRVEFESYDYESSLSLSEGESQRAAHARMKQALKGSWILDKNDKFYVYMPNVYEYVAEYVPRPGESSMLKYEFAPVADCLHLTSLFPFAENVSYEGEEVVKLDNRNVNAHVLSYELSYPVIGFAEKATLRTWISNEDYIPLKSVVHATYGDTSISMEFGFKSYERKPISAGKLKVPEELTIVKR